MSRYTLETLFTEGKSGVILKDRLRRAEASIYPELGNNAVAFLTTPEENSGLEPTHVLVPPAHLSEFSQSPFGSGNPLLFPFPNRVRQGTYTFEGQNYRMDKLLSLGRDWGAGQAIHGLVADQAWIVEDSGADENSAFVRSGLQLDAHPDIFEQYPFGCAIRVTYRLREGVLEMHTEVENTGQNNLPMGFGIHPWFPVHLQPGARLPDTLATITPAQRANAEVRIPAAALWELDKLMPTGKVIPAAGEFDLNVHRPLADHFYDHVFTGVVRREDGWSEASIADPETGLEAYLAADSAFREWVLYAPLDRPVVALEPYTCPTDAVNLQAQGLDAGLVTLAPGETWRGSVHFGLRRHKYA